MTDRLETQIRDYAESVVAAGSAVTLDDVLAERVGEGSVSVLRSRQPRRRSLVGLVAAAVIAALVAGGVLASRSEPETTVPPATQPPTTLPATTAPPTTVDAAPTTTVTTSTTLAPLIGIDGGSAIDAGWRWVSLDERVGIAADRSDYVGSLSDGRLVASEARAQIERSGSIAVGDGCCSVLVSTPGGDWVEHPMEGLEGRTLYALEARAGLIWAETNSEGEFAYPLQLWVSADGGDWRQSNPQPESVLEDWQSWGSALPPNVDFDFYFVRAPDGSILYTGTESELWRSADEGVTFERVAPPGASGPVLQFWADAEGVKVRFREPGQLFVSSDGLTWQEVGEPGPYEGPVMRSIGEFSPEPFVIAAPDGTLVTVDPDRVPPRDSGELALFFSDDGGGTWEKRLVRLPFEGPWVMASDSGWLRAVGAGSSTFDSDQWVTRDGITWYSFPGTAFDFGAGSSGAIFDPETNSVAVPPSP